MFFVKHLQTGEVFKVYDVTGTHFLLYIREKGQQPHWEYADMSMFEPIEEESL